MADSDTIKLEINGREVTALKGGTVLRAAELNDVYIPTLCSHKDLSPFGGCRMCIVEIDGIRGYPLACYTTAEEGMKVRTDTVAIQEIRHEVLQLILSEHPSSCLICPESEECKKFMGTVRKAGISTGCRYCPNDNQCELQDVVERLGVTQVDYPILYRGHEVEREDPFYDRDYNICILCGRCVRMCQEMRGTSVLAFNWRGTKAVVGPAFGRDHIEAGCEFCGACVEVCPTGALAEKASKWDGKPDSSTETTCPYCAIGCRLDAWHKDGRVSKLTPVLDPQVNDGQACLKGRFCMGEVSHHFERARKPMMMIGGYWKELPWGEAIDAAAEKLRDSAPDDFAMLISPDCCNESIYAAQKFARAAIGTNGVDSTARGSLGASIDLWAKLFRRPVSLQGINKASRIIAVGLDTRFNFSIVGVEIRKALQSGARLVTLDARESNLSGYAHTWLRPKPGLEGTLLGSLVKAIRGRRVSLKRAAKECGVDAATLQEAVDLLGTGDEDLTVVIGPAVFRYTSAGDLHAALKALMSIKGANVIPLYNGTNTRGLLEMGGMPELLPGMASTTDDDSIAKIEKSWGTKIPTGMTVTLEDLLSGAKRPKVLYLVGAMPFFERPDCDFLIVQDVFEPHFKTDLFLPAASFLETAGTLTNVEGRVQDIPRLEELPDSVMFGRARPDWWIVSQIAGKLGRTGFDWKSADDVIREISDHVKGFPKPGKLDRKSRVLPRGGQLPESDAAAAAPVRANGDFQLMLHPGGYSHRGVEITSKVEGLQILNPEEGFHLNSEDAAALGVEEGQTIKVTADGIAVKGPARIRHDLPASTVYLYVPEAVGGLQSRADLEPLYRLKQNPCPVEVSKDAV